MVGIHASRRVFSRGSTPLLPDDPYLPPLIIPSEYEGRVREYRELLNRGATPLMCQLYDLGFDQESGIIAWADDELFEEFTNEEMTEDGRWMIFLGRQVQLNPKDEDGSFFMVELLEETMDSPHSPIASMSEYRWVTERHPDGVWATRPELVNDNQMEVDSDDDPLDFAAGQNTLRNEYDVSEDDLNMDEEQLVLKELVHRR